jgi:hypothetical protein
MLDVLCQLLIRIIFSAAGYHIKQRLIPIALFTDNKDSKLKQMRAMKFNQLVIDKIFPLLKENGFLIVENHDDFFRFIEFQNQAIFSGSGFINCHNTSTDPAIYPF